MSAVLSMPVAPRPSGGFYHEFAQTDADVADSLSLRHRVFVEEKGARASGVAGRETDALDAYCLHIGVRDSATHRLVASTRVLTHEAAIAAGGFYSATEFDIAAVLERPGRFLEIGRTCVDPAYRSGAAITALWAGLAELIRGDDYDHLIGCASIDLAGGLSQAHAICDRILTRQPAPADCRVTPYRVLPRSGTNENMQRISLPPLIKAYLRLGARVGGAPCHDPDFNVADVFMHLDLAALAPRYARHFLGAVPPRERHTKVRLQATRR